MSISALVLATSAVAMPPADHTLDCVPADETQSRSATLLVTYDEEQSYPELGVDVRIVPLAGFDDPSEIVLRNVQLMRLQANPGDPSAGTFVRIASGMGGDKATTPWRISVAFPSSSAPDGPILTSLWRGIGKDALEHEMTCSLRTEATA